MIDRKRDKEMEALANEFGRAMAAGMAKNEIEVWNSALQALITQLENSGKEGELVSLGDVVEVAKSLMKGDGDSPFMET
jgi:hypothetical protein